MIWQPANLTEVCATIPAASQLTACSSFAITYLNLLVSLYGDSQDRILQEKYRNNLCDDEKYNNDETIETEEYDFIIVGAGAAGCMIANRLTEIDEWKVLLLEAGPEQPDVTLIPAICPTLLGSNIDWQYKTQPNGKSCLARPGQQCDWPRGKMMGGSTSINSYTFIRGNKLDYDGWAEQGNDGWSYEDVLPFFKKWEKNLNNENSNPKYHGVDGELAVSRFPYMDDPSHMLVEAFVEKGLPHGDYNAESQLSTMMSQAFAQNGVRVSNNQAFIQYKRNKKNLSVKVESEVSKILIDDNKVAYGVEYTRNGIVYKATATKEVIVSGGTINSPKLLMLSGIGPKKHLKDLNIPLVKDLAVGENLHDHLSFNGIVLALPNNTATLVSQDQMMEDLYDYQKAEYKDGPLSAIGPVNVVTFIKTNPSLPAPDIQFQANPCIWREYINDPVNYERVAILPDSYYDAIIPRPMNLVPKSRGKLLLNATDPNGSPLIYPNYLGNQADLVPVIKAVKFFLELEETEAFKSRGAYFIRTPLEACKNFAWGTDAYIACLVRSYTSPTHHYAGTCKMGPISDKKAVVDPKLKVHGIQGLRVIDGSIMPSVNRGNTNAPTMMIAERGVAFVIEEWLEKSKCIV